MCSLNTFFFDYAFVNQENNAKFAPDLEII